MQLIGIVGSCWRPLRAGGVWVQFSGLVQTGTRAPQQQCPECGVALLPQPCPTHPLLCLTRPSSALSPLPLAPPPFLPLPFPPTPQVRTQTLVKNAIIQIDAAPFKQWYLQHYGTELGQKKGSEDKAEAEAKVWMGVDGCGD